MSALAPENLEFFESRVRPLLVEQCLDCHTAGDGLKGGLALDSAEGWRAGGDSGPALVPGDVEGSLIIKAVRYHERGLQMPPKNRLSAGEVATLEEWVRRGAPDPRTGGAPVAKHATGMSVEEGRRFWSYRAPEMPAVPDVAKKDWPVNDVDRFLLARMEQEGLAPVADAEPAVQVRRLYLDLTGLPPTPEQIDEWLASPTEENRERLVDRLLNSPRFGEQWGRHWLDVVRYAESLTLRGFVFSEAWRYRDYVIDAFNHDLPYDRFLREQVAGDLLPAPTHGEGQRQSVATTFLVLGNHNMEEQDKAQLSMDIVDEQLDTIGKAFLGQTLGCARCHDHKFDPIPTRDYYAMAGILRSVASVKHENVSKWIEPNLPLPHHLAARYDENEKTISLLEKELKGLRGKLNTLKDKLATSDENPSDMPDLSGLPGVTLDDTDARLVGEWTGSTYSSRFFGRGYVHDANADKGARTATFIPKIGKPGRYEVRLSYVPAENRATNVPVTIFSADGETIVRINQQDKPPLGGGFVSLGTFRFLDSGEGFILVSNEGTDGIVVVDALHLLPEELAKQEAPAAAATAASRKSPEHTAMEKAIQAYDSDLKALKEELPPRPRAMGVNELDSAADCPVHVRGNVHRLGETVPRGFLQVASPEGGEAYAFASGESGRRQLGEWLSSKENPLTARVMANRVWQWLFGAGLVRSVDNFGTTGDAPTHPELLDHLAVRFMEDEWSVKRLVRSLVLSRAYRLSSVPGEEAAAGDPGNRLLSHFQRKRLRAEAMHDTLLLVAGRLDTRAGGSRIASGTATDYLYQHRDTCRAVYRPAFRNSPVELLALFDMADPSMVVGARHASTVAPQALYLMNHAFVREQAEASARRWLELEGSVRDKVTLACRSLLGRPPTEGEWRVARDFLEERNGATPEAERWSAFFQALYASADFRFVE